MAEPNAVKTDRFLLETVRLAVALDSVTVCDLPDNVAAVLRQGYSRFGELLLRRASLPMTPEEDMLIGWVLDVIVARLRFLQGLHHRNVLN
jgi:hypothetical protein